MKTLILFLSLTVSQAQACWNDRDCGPGQTCGAYGCEASGSSQGGVNSGGFGNGFEDSKPAFKICTTNFQCGFGQSCVKDFGASRGVCQ